MYNLHLSPEQLQIRDTVRDFVVEVIKPLALRPERLEARARPLLVEALDQAAQMGLRTLALSEDRGGAGADNLTCCIVTEELAAGDPDVASVLAQTATLAQALFDRLMTAEQRARFLPPFLTDHRYHLALAEREADRDAALGINYHRPQTSHAPFKTAAVRAGDGWVVSGSKEGVVGASLAALFVVRASVGESSVATLLVPRDTPGLTVTETETADCEIIKKGSQLGVRNLAVPEEWGGHGTDFVTQALVMAELAKADSAISKTFSQCWKWSHLIAAACSEEQKRRFLKPFLEDDTFLLGKGISEPSAGSDNRLPPDDPKAGLKLRAERHGDEWILNGEKCFIANARVGKVFNKDGWRFYQNGEMIFENARVPHANVVGPVNGSDMKTQQAGDRTGGDLFGDLELAANALGVCDDACGMALTLARTKKQSGRVLFEQQAVQLKLNRMHLLTEALRSFVMRVAWEHDHKLRSANAGLCMNFSTDVIQEVTELNFDIHASAGVMDRRTDKLVRDAIIWSHLAGDSVQRMKATRRLGR